MKIIGVIPAHMASVRFPNKVLYNIYDLPMIEHVRRRVLLSNLFERVIVATCDDEIEDTVISFGGDVIRSLSPHTSGTSRAAEAIKNITCSHVVVVQGDEPLLLPSYLHLMVDSMRNDIYTDSWNLTAPLISADQLSQESHVKCIVTPNDNILYCFRKSPSIADFSQQRLFTRKILGLIGYTKTALVDLISTPTSFLEHYEFIEQLTLLVNSYSFKSVPAPFTLPSLNEPCDFQPLISLLESDDEQKYLLSQVLSFFT